MGQRVNILEMTAPGHPTLHPLFHEGTGPAPPTFAGIVTRRPLTLQLLNVPKGTDAKPYGEFFHKPGVKFTEFTRIRDEIQCATDDEAGAGKAISRKPIQLKIYSPDVLNLTLVDLPGITKGVHPWRFAQSFILGRGQG